MMDYLDWRVLCFAGIAWAALELVFLAVTMLYLAPRMNRLEPPAKYPIESKQLVHKILETLDWLSDIEDSECDFESFLKGWFLGAHSSELRLGNVIVFLAWAMYAKDAEALSKGERENVFGVVKLVEDRLGRTLEPGHNPEVHCIRHTLEPVVPFTHRPLALYALLGACRGVARGVLNAHGFRRRLAPCGTFSYWHRATACSSARGKKGLEAESTSSPIVFFHGVGGGLPWYFFAILTVCRERTSILVESPSITMSLHLLRGHRAPSEAELVESVEGIMERHGLRQAAFFGHSFGSIAVAWMARRRPQLVSQIVLLDPVCLLLFLPNVARAFLHPDQMGMALHRRMMLNFITQEKGISHTLRRHFWWYANVLWPEDIQCPMVVGLAGLDKIVPAKPLRRLLLSHPSFAASNASPAAENSSGYSDDSAINGGPGGGCGNGCRNGDGQVNDDGSTSSVHRRHGTRGSVSSGNDGGRTIGNRNGSARKGRSSSADKEEGVCPGGLERGARGGENAPAATTTRRAELVYWPEAGHGRALGDLAALRKLMWVVKQQEETFLLHRASQ